MDFQCPGLNEDINGYTIEKGLQCPNTKIGMH